MNRRAAILFSVFTFLFLAVDMVHGFTRQPDTKSWLIAVDIPADSSLERFSDTGLPAYSVLRADELDVIIAGANEDDLGMLHAADLSYSVLDDEIQGKEYYIAAGVPSEPTPEWDMLGKVLLQGDKHVLLQVDGSSSQRLLSSGIRLQRLFLEPMVLSPSPSADPIADDVAYDPLIQSMMDQVASSTLYKYVGDLSGEWPAMIYDSSYTIHTRHTNSGEPIAKAVDYVTQHLEGTGMAIEHHSWNSTKPPNVIGEITGEVNPEDIYLITAHLDSTARSPANPLLTAPGADDNASGAAGVMVAASIFSQYRWGCTLRFAFFTGEEQGLLGSNVYADRSLDDGENILGVLNMDMIGYNTKNSARGIDLEYAGSVNASQDLAFLFGDVINTYSINLIPGYDSSTCCSDHVPFLQNGFPAILAIEDFNDFNPQYHTTNDLLSNLDMGYFTDLLKASVGTFAHLADCMLTAQYLPVVQTSSGGSDAALVPDGRGIRLEEPSS